jgi:hypothetical protein
MVSELRLINASVVELEQEIKSGQADSSIARTVALLFVDEIGRCQILLQGFEYSMEHYLFIVDFPFEKNVRRAREALSIYGRLLIILKRATDEVLSCIRSQ